MPVRRDDRAPLSFTVIDTLNSRNADNARNAIEDKDAGSIQIYLLQNLRYLEFYLIGGGDRRKRI
jgi:hypothetical protein